MSLKKSATWNFEGEKERLLALGAPDNSTDLDVIIQSRRARRDEIFHILELKPSDRVLDLGSGMGFIAEIIAPEVARLYCADISESFLSDCRARLAAIANVEVLKIEYADLSPLYGQDINKAYATLVFIHFNFYDILYYLTELNKVLVAGGLLYFDYNDGERFSLNQKADSFHVHLAIYKENREHWIFGCMHMTSLGVLRNLAPQVGFEIRSNWQSDTCFSTNSSSKNW